LRRDVGAWVGILIIGSLVVVSVAAPMLPLADPNHLEPRVRLQAPPAAAAHRLGTDEFGRDMLSRIVWGGRISLLAGLATAAGSLTLGLPLGVVGGYAGGGVDNLIMRFTEVVMAFPYLLLAIAVVAALGAGLVNAMIALSVTGFPIYARLSRSLVLRLRGEEFVEAARAVGATDARIIQHHILPNLASPAIVAFSLDIGSKVIATAGLSFLGLGVQPPTADWGSMLATGRAFITTAPHVSVLPGMAIALTVLGANLLGDALRDALDPALAR
jgi:peptide/nickel transport system permease protein